MLKGFVVVGLVTLSFGIAAAGTEPLTLTPASAWAVSGSGIGPVCDSPPSPAQLHWQETANGGVSLSVVGTNIQCCDCVRRSARFAVGNTDIAGAHLTGTFTGQNVGTYADASFRVIMLSGTANLGQKVYSTQQRANNNCAGQSEEPETIVNSGQPFDIDLSTLNKNQSSAFDAIEVEVLGYACPDGSSNTASAVAEISGLNLVAPAAPSTAVAAMASPGVTSPWKNGPEAPDGGAASTDSGTNNPIGGKSGCAFAPGPAGSVFFALLVLGALFLIRSRRSMR